MRLHPAAWSLFLLLAAGIVTAGFLAFGAEPTRTPAYTTPTIDGGTFDLASERGHVVVLDFFNVYCEGCAILENDLKALVPTWNASQVRVVSVGMPAFNEDEYLRPYAQEHNITWTVARDADHAQEKFSVIAFPTLAVVDPQGEIVFHQTGLPGAARIDHAVQDALSPSSTPVAYARYPLWGIAIVAAVASFFSPCAVGLLPAYVGHTVRFSPGERRPILRAAKMGMLAAAGLLLVFLGMGGIAYAFGRAVAPYVTWLAPMMGGVFVLVGLLLLLRPYSLWLQRVFAPLSQPQGERASNAASYFLYGIGYGAGAAGCTAPVLLSLAALASSAGAAFGIALIGLYAVTAAVLMAVLTIVIAGGRTGAASWIRRHAHQVEVASALLFVAGGVFLLWFAWRAGTLAL